jgi:ribosomal protein S16
VTNPPAIELNMERVRHWIERGAQPSETVSSLMKKMTPPPVAG